MNSSALIDGIFIFVLAGFIGFEVIRRVSPLLHTPLMSLTNALDAIAVVGAIVLVGEHKNTLSATLGTIAVAGSRESHSRSLRRPDSIQMPYGVHTCPVILRSPHRM